jgi:signal transduction histidine kinase
MIAVELGGWLAASAAGVVAARVWRAAAWRMETIARACHELRGPLTAARLGLDYGAGNGQLTPARLRAIDLELGRAALALDDLEGVRTQRTGWRPREPIDLEQLVSDSVEAWRASAAAHGVELRSSWSGVSPTVWGDRLRLAQVTGNLISNAIEHGGGAVEVRGSVVEVNGSVVEVNGSVVEVNGSVVEVNGSVVEVNGSVVDVYASSVEAYGSVVEANGSVVEANGSVVDGHGPGGGGHGCEGPTRARIEVTDTGPGLPAPVSELARRAQGGRGRRGRGLAIAAAIAAEHGGRLAAAPSVRGARLVLELPTGGRTVASGDGADPSADAPT